VQPEAKQHAADAPLIEARGVTVQLGGEAVVDRVDLAVRSGEIVTLIGPNGAGKSSLVRALLELVPTAAGEIHRRPGLSVGYLPQRLVVDPVLPLSVGRFLTLTRRRPQTELAAALAEVGAQVPLSQPMHSLSGGQSQRVMLARALLREPDLLVLDEPVQGIDYAGQYALYDVISDIRRRHGCGILMVSHDLHLVMAATDRVVCLNRHVCCSGEPESVTRDPAYLALFGPAGARHLAIYTHDHDHRHDNAGRIVHTAATERAAGRPGPP
jgi:zinc transport system ATP-binding protein